MIQNAIATTWWTGVKTTSGAALALLDSTVGWFLDTNPDKVR